MFVTITEHSGKVNAINKTWIAYTGSEISGIKWRRVFCAHKPDFLTPGHICAFMDKFSLLMIIIVYNKNYTIPMIVSLLYS